MNRVGIYFTRSNDLIPEEANAEAILAIDIWVGGSSVAYTDT